MTEDNILTSYNELIVSKALQQDAAQQQLVIELQSLATRLEAKKTNFYSKLWRKLYNNSTNQGLYIWGQVGRGKTLLMDLFFNNLKTKRKKRLHFYRFMQKIHTELANLKGRSEPLKIIANNLAQEYDVLCLDELFVNDIGDAMLLGELLTNLFKQGVILVITSNVVPEDLYKNGLQRSRFLPAITKLIQHLQIVELTAICDYRMRTLERLNVYHCAAEQEAYAILEEIFKNIAPDKTIINTTISICEREIKVRQLADDCIWFDFKELCATTRSYTDYIEIARDYHTVLLSYLPVLTEQPQDWTRRFISLIDEFYDRRVKLIIAAESEPEELYTKGALQFEFKRTISRLTEMQTKSYLGREHISA